MHPIRILIADDAKNVRHSLRLLMDNEADVVVVGEAADGIEAVEKVVELQPDLVLMDAQMPRLDGIQATRLLKEAFPRVKVIVLTVYADRLLEALLAGASHYLLKGCSREELIEKIRETVAVREAPFN